MASLHFVSHGLTHVGLVRSRNEDAFLDRPEHGLWAVADGMGGHEGGDVASAAIVGALGGIDPPPDLDEFARLASAGLTLVDAALRQRAARLGPNAVIASTVVVLLAREDRWAALWAGDSRLYRWRDGELKQLTVDHSQVQELVNAGHLTPEDATGHPAAHIVTRAIGAGPVECAEIRDGLRPGDRYLLCSDGLTNMVANAEIERELGAAEEPRDAVKQLCDLVLARGAIDNFTILAVAVQDAGT